MNDFRFLEILVQFKTYTEQNNCLLPQLKTLLRYLEIYIIHVGNTYAVKM